MDFEQLLRTADFSQHSAAHKEALREALFGKTRKRGFLRKREQTRELTLDDLEDVTAAGQTWIKPEDFPK